MDKVIKLKIVQNIIIVMLLFVIVLEQKWK